MPQAGPIERPVKATRASRVAEDLRQSILRGDLAPGEKVNLDRLRTHFGISLSPLREAVSRLVTVGLVESEDQRGFRIAPVSVDDLAEVTRLRADFESLALGYAVELAEIDWESAVLGALHRLNRASRDPSATDSAREAAHSAFHLALIEGCGMPILVGFCRNLHDLNLRYRRLFGAGLDENRDMSAEHVAIAEAAAVRRDADAACVLLRRHVERTGLDLSTRISRPPDQRPE
ncbi:GntR family transcriptional regulator [Defluviimonas sp. SAOS-178_SWC]|uniref:GntR family transcriptional regulator n=1 Tax=Defluviimonas sp. SAOS-178_SWC TaxID=3121287 RepID=UPI003221F07D